MRYARICAMLAFQRGAHRIRERDGTDARIALHVGTRRSAFPLIWGNNVEGINEKNPIRISPRRARIVATFPYCKLSGLDK
jgi:hypothetical protein